MDTREFCPILHGGTLLTLCNCFLDKEANAADVAKLTGATESEEREALQAMCFSKFAEEFQGQYRLTNLGRLLGGIDRLEDLDQKGIKCPPRT